ncbi:MbnP family protein [Neolewinella persica]|uniref:MbnP family protein n=1 Tax=Neolewinella persica TaxID=70998 RepID=UPI000372F200|nr:MbnP family protein [Neolewinella persica]
MKHLLPILCLFFSTLSAQEVFIDFQPVMGGKALVIDDTGAAAGAEKVVEAMRFYLSDVALRSEGQVVSTSDKRHHLLDAAQPETMRFPLSVPAGVAYDELSFTLGVDSLTAASGAFGGDLDPTNGMYWTWRSGYINFKLEGTAPECPARKNRFQFHVGGFQGPFNSERAVSLGVSPGKTIPVKIDLDRFFDQINLAATYQIMSPDDRSATIADLLVELFR